MHKLFLCGLCLAMFLSACGQQGSLESRDIADLEARVVALEAQLAAVPTPVAEEHPEATDGDAFDVAVAQYIMDNAGFHAIDEGLNETQAVDPAYLTSVNRVRKVVAQAPWPEELHEQAGAFVDLLTEFATVLEADNGEEAATLAAEAHTAQHDLSHAVDNWLSGGEGEHEHGG